MKKSFVSCILILLLLMLPMTAMAAGSGDSEATLNYVTDLYGLLTREEAAHLEAQAKAISQQYQCSIYILVVKDYQDYSYDTFQFAIDTYNNYKLGWGEEKTGVLLMLSMADRDYELLFNGSLTDTAFTEYGRDRMEERIVDNLRNGDYYGGFQTYQNTCAEYLQAALNGKPVDYEKSFSVFHLIPGMFASLISYFSLSAPMRSTGTRHDANAYFAEGRVNLRERSDVFLNRTVTRTPRQTPTQNRGGGGGGGGGSHHSGSFSGRSGKF